MCRGAAECIDDIDELCAAHLEGLQVALLAYERALLAPDDEHVADRDARMRRILARWDDALASVTEAMLRSYLTLTPPWQVAASTGFLTGNPTPFCWSATVHGVRHGVSLYGVSPKIAVDGIATAEGRHAALVLLDLLPRGWGMEGSR